MEGGVATYRQIQERVKSSAGFVPETCWIAHVKSDHGLVRREAFNRADSNVRRHPCPPGRRDAIEDALRHYGMI